MNNINTQIKALLEKHNGFSRVFGLTNSTAVNAVKKGKSPKLSESTMDNVAAASGYKAITVFIPLEATNSAVEDCIEEANNAFIETISKTLADDQEKKDVASAARMEKARAKMEENKVAKEATTTTEDVVTVQDEVTLDITSV